MSRAAVGLTPLTELRLTGELTVVNGHQGIRLPNGKYLSCNPNPDGSFASWGEVDELREYERCNVAGNIVTFNPLGKPLAFFFVPQVPNV